MHRIAVSLCLLSAVVCAYSQVYCPDGRTECAAGNTCCLQPSGSYGCCPAVNATCCPDGVHCCPSGFVCNVTECTKNRIRRPLLRKQPATVRTVAVSAALCSNGHQCSSNETCCLGSDSDSSFCCPHGNGQCCSERLMCCPSGYSCNGFFCIPAPIFAKIDDRITIKATRGHRKPTKAIPRKKTNPSSPAGERTHVRSANRVHRKLAKPVKVV